MATASEINSKVDEAVNAIETGNLSTAMTKLLSAQALMAATPDRKFRTSELAYDRRSIGDLIKTVRRQQHAGAGMQISNIEKVSTTDTP